MKKIIYSLASSTELTIRNVATAVDKQDQMLLNIIKEVDWNIRAETSNALHNITINHSNVNSKLKSETETKLSNLKQDISIIKDNSDISQFYHDSIYKDLEKYVSINLKIKDITSKQLDEFLHNIYLIEKDKTRKIDGKEIKLTLPVYIRHFSHHPTNEDNEKPKIEEIQKSISIILNILNNKK
ncbi:hypothetical protein SSYRP_v1c00720 [Spiroplasma syrphidicola EA-1]|uniref:Uncharacterized protein n=1 Tax=Spiroplasma syrphidicola EA-1 TaxID=1276229 RepID=R4U547_9MOLU|nr:hypothetical protein [Spiroplasma syrphidicola]AGM25668.1 hypothetical protein SSYRP_v1c00720 [Spiroplasma syrphidicola EA-1]